MGTTVSVTGIVVNITTDPETGDRIIDIIDEATGLPDNFMVGPVVDPNDDAIEDSFVNDTIYIWEYNHPSHTLASVTKP